MTVMGVDTVLWVGLVVAAAAVGLLLILVAPWKSVRDEPPLDADVATRLMLGEDPATVAADVDATEARGNGVVDLDATRPDAD